MSDANQTLSTPLAELARIQTLITDITAALRSEREQLRTRGINLPPLVMQTLTAAAGEVGALDGRIAAEQTELGQLRSLVDSGAMINTSFDIERVLNRAMDIVITLTGAERGYIILVDPDSGALEYRVQSEPDVTGQFNLAAPDPQVSQSLIREVLRTGQPILTDSAFQDARFEGHKSIATMALRSVLCVPLRYKDDVIGVVYVDNRLRAGLFEERELNLLAAFANQVAVALTNAHLFTSIQRALAEITTVRELTGSVFESVGSGIITTDADGVITMFNDAAAEILEGLRDTQGRLGDALHSEALGELLAQVRGSSTPRAVETEISSPSGRRLYASIKLSPLMNAEKVTEGVALVIDDLTEQHERSAMLNIMRRYLPPQMVDNIHTISGLDLGGERREITCVFVNVRPVATLPDGLRPQEIMELINGYLTAATTCIHAVEGVIDKYMGTEIMALFNSQLNPQANHAALAVEAALRIRDRFAELDGDGAAHFRIGIHSGVATLGNVGSFSRRDFTAIGDAINLAKRLEENAAGGQIIISEDTRRLIDGRGQRFEVRAALTVKGRTTATGVFEAFRA